MNNLQTNCIGCLKFTENWLYNKNPEYILDKPKLYEQISIDWVRRIRDLELLKCIAFVRPFQVILHPNLNSEIFEICIEGLIKTDSLLPYDLENRFMSKQLLKRIVLNLSIRDSVRNLASEKLQKLISR